jgi:uncharacterized membrane protein
MANTLTVWKFDTVGGALDAERRLLALQSTDLITVNDAAVVSWDIDKKKPKTRQLNSTTGTGALGGAFWGFLFGLIFFVPLIGIAVGAVSGALGGALTDVGIDDAFIKRVQAAVTPGTSALFLLTSNEVVERVSEELGPIKGELIETNLDHEQEAALRAAFTEE